MGFDPVKLVNDLIKAGVDPVFGKGTVQKQMAKHGQGSSSRSTVPQKAASTTAKAKTASQKEAARIRIQTAASGKRNVAAARQGMK